MSPTASTRLAVASAVVLACLAIFTATADAQTDANRCLAGTPGCERDHTSIGNRLQLLRSVVRSEGVDSPFFVDGTPAGVTAERVGASLRFEHPLEETKRRWLEERLDIEFRRDAEGGLERIGSIYLATIPWDSFDRLAEVDGLIRAESTWAPEIVPPLEVTAEKVGATHVRQRPALQLDGEGIVFGDIDSGFDIYHPHLFRADGEWYAWRDANDNGRFDPGIDGVDLNQNGNVDTGEELKVLDATIISNSGRRHNDGALQPGRDWVYIDVNGDGTRNVGPDAGFTEEDPAYGEPIFVADDVNDNGTFDPMERLARLDSSKFQRVFEGNTEYERGKDLIEVGKPRPQDRSYHGTGVASILIGGQPGFHDRVGLAPAADIVGYSHSSGDGGGGLGQFGLQQQFLSDATSSGVDLVVHEWTDFFSTPQDGSTNLETALDEARSQGVVQVNPLGNLNLSQKHVERQLAADRPETLEIQVDQGFQSRGQTLPYFRMWGALLWDTKQQPSFTIVTPSGERVPLTANQQKTVGSMTIRGRAQTSPRGTHHLIFAVSVNSRQDRVEPGTWQIEVDDVKEEDTLIGRVMDAYSSWGVGIRWKQPTRDRGTMVFPSTADSAFGVAAYAGRSAQPNDGMGSQVGELRNYSGRGPRIDGARGVDIAAPDDPIAAFGVNTEWTDRGIKRGGFREFGGTSGAGPHVAAAIGLLKQANPSWGPDQLEQTLLDTANQTGLTPVLDSPPDTRWGHGKVDLLEAVTDRQTPRAGEAPTAELTLRRVSDVTDEYVEYDASASSDADSDTLEYRFDYDYDGEWDGEWSDSATARVLAGPLLEEGAVVGKVQVRDELGQKAAALAKIDPSPDPMADAGIDAGDDAGSDGETDPPDDAGSTGDGGVSWGDLDVKLADDSGGCNCRSTGGAPPVGWLVAAFGLLALRRRRSS